MSTAAKYLKLQGPPQVVDLPLGRQEITVQWRVPEYEYARATRFKEFLFQAKGTSYGSGDGIDPNYTLEPPPADVFENAALTAQKFEEYRDGPESDAITLLTKVYETLTSSWVLEDVDKPGSTDSGLREVTRSQVALPGTSLPYSESDVGVSTLTSGGKSLKLASVQDLSTDSKGKVVTKWMEPGILNRTEDKVGSQNAIVIEAFMQTPEESGHTLAKTADSNYEGAQSKRYTFLKPSVLSRSTSTKHNGKLIIETVEAFNQTPSAATSGAVQIGNQVSNVDGVPTRRYTFARGQGQIRSSTRPGRVPGTTEITVVSLGVPVIPPGVLLAEDDSEADGYIRYVRTSVQGTITGIKQSYKDVISVRTPGTVTLGAISTTVGGLSGTIAVPSVVPPRQKQIAATVTVEVTNTPPNTADLAFDLGNISCSVVSRQVAYNSRGTDLFKTKSGKTRVKAERFSASMSGRITHYPGCYYTGDASASGQFSYVAAQSLADPDSDNSIVLVPHTSNSMTFLDASGASDKTGYQESGIIRRRSRPILSTLDGTIYYEVITWSV